MVCVCMHTPVGGHGVTHSTSSMACQETRTDSASAVWEEGLQWTGFRPR